MLNLSDTRVVCLAGIANKAVSVDQNIQTDHNPCPPNKCLMIDSSTVGWTFATLRP